MPITLDTNQNDLDQQIQKVNTQITSNQKVDAKYFSKSLTGSASRKTGLFNKDADTITDFMQNNRKRLQNTIRRDEGMRKNMKRMDEHLFGEFFHQNTKPKDDDYKKFENNLTTMLPPLMLYKAAMDDIALSFPKNTGMYNLNAIETNWTRITGGTIDGEDASVYIKPVIQSMRLYAKEVQSTSNTGYNQSESRVSAQPEIYVLVATVMDGMAKDGTITVANNEVMGGRSVHHNTGVMSVIPLTEMSESEYHYAELNKSINRHLDTVIDNHTQHVDIPHADTYHLSLIIGDMSMSELLKSQAATMTHQAEEALMTFIDTMTRRAAEIENKPVRYGDKSHLFNSIFVAYVQHIDLLNEIEDNIVSTNLLASIFNTIKTNLGDSHKINNIARHSLRLLLSQRLHELDEIQNADGLYTFSPQNQQVIQNMQNNPDFSNQQKRIVTTTDPLVIGQAGAGSGKSHTLIGRLSYLYEQGEDLNKVLVLSFTNVAAVNINNRFPGVRSETLANMFNSIYSSTYPSQALSQPSTVANSIRLLNPASNYFKKRGIDEDEIRSFINQFAIRLEQFDQTGFKRVNLQQELKRLSNLVEHNMFLTEMVLDAVQQTTLELQPIVIHHQLLHENNQLNIPDVYKNLNYIITDESQDISTFEYILLLEMTIHHRSQLLIIGDGSQTLYEFRNSDPRYMNALEASNVFTSHKLETNYRSNEEVLMFANQFLQIIDANKHAQIQLQSSSFYTPDETSFQNRVIVDDLEVNGRALKDYTETLNDYLANDDDFQAWFLERVKNGEQVAFMGWTRKEVNQAGETIRQLLDDSGYQDTPITSIMSNKDRPMTILSRFARDKNEILRQLDPSNPTFLADLSRQIDEFVNQTFTRSSQKQLTFYRNFISDNIKEVTRSQQWQILVNDYVNGNVTINQIGGYMIQSLLNLETKKNKMNQHLNKQKEIPNYDECPVILSTIHGTKGLEFENTVIMFNEGKRGATAQDSLRMMFVALSRAKKGEFIINAYPYERNRTVSDVISAMFKTPMNTAYKRTLNDIKRLNAAKTP